MKTQDEKIGARRVARGGGGVPWWVVMVALIVLLALAAGAWLLLADDDSDVEVVDEGATATSAPATPTSAPATSTSGPATGGNTSIRPGEVFAGDQRVLPGGESQLTRFVGQPAEGRTVRVLSAPSDESFWVGTSPQTGSSSTWRSRLENLRSMSRPGRR